MLSILLLFFRWDSKRTTFLSRKVILSDDLIFYPGAAFLKNCPLIPPGSHFHRGPSLRGGRVLARTEGFVLYYHSPILGGRMHELCKNTPQHPQFMIKSIIKQKFQLPGISVGPDCSIVELCCHDVVHFQDISTISSRKQKVNTSHVCWRLFLSLFFQSVSGSATAHLPCKHLSYSPMT